MADMQNVAQFDGKVEDIESQKRKVEVIDEHANHINYPTTKAVKDYVDANKGGSNYILTDDDKQEIANIINASIVDGNGVAY